MKITAIYVRVSTDAQAEEGYSIDAQKEQLQAYCIAKGWKNHEFYVDGGWSGSNIERPEMNRLIDQIKKGVVERCLVYKLDRLSRSQKDVLYLIEDVFMPHSVDFISLTENIDTSTPMGRAMIGILAAFAQLERENIMMRTRMGMKERVKQGLWMGGGRIPFGYDYDKDQGILVPNQDADTVKKIYKLYLEGYSAQTIANMLGLTYEKLVMQILTRKSNIGIITYNGEEYQGKHEPIITEDEFYRAQQEIMNRSKQKTSCSDHLLTGLIRCGKCGAKMRYQKWSKKGAKIVCYSQQSHKPYLVKDPNCDQERVWAGELEEVVINKIFQLHLEKSGEAVKKEETPMIMILEERQSSIIAEIRRLYNLYAKASDDLLLETIEQKKKDLEEVKKQLEAEIRVKALSEQKNTIASQINNIQQAWDYMTIMEKQQFCRMIISEVVLTGDKVDIKLKI